MWGPYVGTLLFLTFGMRGLEPLKRFLYDRQKRRKQAKKGTEGGREGGVCSSHLWNEGAGTFEEFFV